MRRSGFVAICGIVWAVIPVLGICAQDEPVSKEGRVLAVDRRGNAPYATIASAVKEARPGDTIKLAPGSGPYREQLFIAQSGEANHPITFDGSGEIITGFDPLEGFWQERETWVCDLPVKFPCVITYRGERLVQDAATKQFTQYAKLSEDGKQLQLLPGVEPTGWEISKRDMAVRILDVSHHLYRNIRASGATNDGFNLHGSGSDLIFENIEAFNNLDEGFSAHDEIACEIRGGKFWRNDNGIGNVQYSKMRATNIQIHSNLGFGLWLADCGADLSDVRCWNNGVAQIWFGGAGINCQDVSAHAPSWKERPWISYTESARLPLQKPIVILSSAAVTGTPPTLLPGDQPPAGSNDP